MNPRYRVTLTEYERGWGSREFHDEDFETQVDAYDYAALINSKLDRSSSAPDTYIKASAPYFVDADANPPR